jgi:hypothetical protein
MWNCVWRHLWWFGNFHFLFKRVSFLNHNPFDFHSFRRLKVIFSTSTSNFTYLDSDWIFHHSYSSTHNESFQQIDDRRDICARSYSLCLQSLFTISIHLSSLTLSVISHERIWECTSDFVFFWCTRTRSILKLCDFVTKLHLTLWQGPFLPKTVKPFGKINETRKSTVSFLKYERLRAYIDSLTFFSLC